MIRGVDYIGVAVIFYCHDGAGNLLLIKRGIKARDEHGKWEVGGGAVDWGETQEQALRREIMEEYCTDVISFELMGIRDDIREHNGHTIHWVAAEYLVEVDHDKAAIGEPEKFTDIGWFKLDHMPDLLHVNLELGLKKYASKLQSRLSN
ncbi:NUDIX domain-containing protein [Candidatus Gracilibacteria bacterium]|nr:NUDIX domain-containing protein [Candidatus Gracilibacteria bacterium]